MSISRLPFKSFSFNISFYFQLSGLSGHHNKNASFSIYLFIAPGDWSDWSLCSAPCGFGTKTRQRNFKNKNGDSRTKTETSSCYLADCGKLILVNSGSKPSQQLLLNQSKV